MGTRNKNQKTRNTNGKYVHYQWLSAVNEIYAIMRTFLPIQKCDFFPP